MSAADPETAATRAATLGDILQSQSRDSTFNQYFPIYQRWSAFARAHGISPLPPRSRDNRDARKLLAVFDNFVLDEYKRNAEKGVAKGKRGRDAANHPGTFDKTFQAINHVVTKIFGRDALLTPLLAQAKTSYRNRFTKPVKKAKPLTGQKVRQLVKFAERSNCPWLNVVAKATLIMWSGAGRFSCVSNIDKARTRSTPACGDVPENPSPDGSYSLVYYYDRKNKKGLTATPLPTMSDKSLDARTAIQWFDEEFDRGEAPKLIPKLHKVRGVEAYTVDPDPDAWCGYTTFLAAFRLAMKMAGLQDELDCIEMTTSKEWSLHGGRRGFVKDARALSNGEPLLYEVLSIHGAWSIESLECMMGYNSVNPAEHAATIRNLMHSALMIE